MTLPKVGQQVIAREDDWAGFWKKGNIGIVVSTFEDPRPLKEPAEYVRELVEDHGEAVVLINEGHFLYLGSDDEDFELVEGEK